MIFFSHFLMRTVQDSGATKCSPRYNVQDRHVTLHQVIHYACIQYKSVISKVEMSSRASEK